MAVTSGFFNSMNGDRRYNAEQMSAIFDGIINDGILANIGTAFTVTSTGGNSVEIGVGRAWFNSTWIYNDAILPLTLGDSDLVLDRIDAIVIEINHTDEVRKGDIIVVKGTPASSPVRPTLTNTEDVHQYALAYVYRKGDSTYFDQADITSMIGTSGTPYVTGILQVQNIDNIVAQWQQQWINWFAGEQVEGETAKKQMIDAWNQWFAGETSGDESEFNTWFAQMKSDFLTWFENLQAVLEPDAATALANKVTDLDDRFETLAKERSVYEDLEDSNDDPILDSTGRVIRGRTKFAASGELAGSGINASIPFDSTIPDTGKQKYEVGDILTTARTDLDDSWLLCNGARVSREQYPKLSELLPDLFSENSFEEFAGIIESSCPPSSYSKYHYTDYLNGYYFVVCTIPVSGTPLFEGLYELAVVLLYSEKLDGPWHAKVLWGVENDSYSCRAYGMNYENGYYIVTGCIRESNSNYANAVIAYSSTIEGDWTVNKNIWSGLQTYSESIATCAKYANGYYVVLGRKSTGTATIAYSTSLDGPWTAKDIWTAKLGYYYDPHGGVEDVVYAGGYFVAVGYATVDKPESVNGYVRVLRIAYTEDPSNTWSIKDLAEWDNYNDHSNHTNVRINYQNGLYLVTGTYGATSYTTLGDGHVNPDDTAVAVLWSPNLEDGWQHQDITFVGENISDRVGYFGKVYYANGSYFIAGDYSTGLYVWAGSNLSDGLVPNFIFKNIMSQSGIANALSNEKFFILSDYIQFLTGGEGSVSTISFDMSTVNLPLISADRAYTYIKALED